MKIKKYLANNLPQAMSMVRQELGREAIILSTRQMKLGGLFGVFGRPAVEVTAAVNESQRQRRKREAPPWEDTSKVDIDGTYTRAGIRAQAEGSRPQPPLSEPFVAVTSDERGGGLPGAQMPLEPGVEPDVEHRRTAPAEAGPIRQATIDLLGACSPTRLDGERCMTVMVIGPSGAGKTTTVAKIAARFALKEAKTVSLVTTDTHRVAGVQQLKAYADIMGIGVDVCYTPDELSAALAGAADRDLVLIDTSGRNYHDPKVLAELRALVEAAQPDEVHLVLPCTMSATAALEACRRYEEVGFDRLVFTKADETNEFGLILNVVRATGQPVSFIGTGRRVPEDIEEATREGLLELFIGDGLQVQAARG